MSAEWNRDVVIHYYAEWKGAGVSRADELFWGGVVISLHGYDKHYLLSEVPRDYIQRDQFRCDLWYFVHDYWR